MRQAFHGSTNDRYCSRKLPRAFIGKSSQRTISDGGSVLSTRLSTNGRWLTVPTYRRMARMCSWWKWTDGSAIGRPESWARWTVHVRRLVARRLVDVFLFKQHRRFPYLAAAVPHGHTRTDHGRSRRGRGRRNSSGRTVAAYLNRQPSVVYLAAGRARRAGDLQRRVCLRAGLSKQRPFHNRLRPMAALCSTSCGKVRSVLRVLENAWASCG
jgi:hypothetical protein